MQVWNLSWPRHGRGQIGGVIARQLHEDHQSVGAFHYGGDRALAQGIGDGSTLPATGYDEVLHFSGTLGDNDHGVDES